MGLRTFLLGTLLCVWAPNALAAQKLKIAEVELTGYVGQDLKIAYDLPCGATFYGVVAKEESSKRLRLGVAYLMGDVRCISLPAREETVLNFINTTGYDSISPLKTSSVRSRFVQNKMIDVRVVRSKKNPKLQLISEPSCGVDLGTLIRQTGSHKLELARLEKLTARQYRAGCPKTQQIKDVKAIRITKNLSVGIIPKKVRDLDRSFSLHLSQIRDGSVKRLKKRGVALSYLRKCNEAPVGVVMDRKIQNGKPSLKVGMLVARYFNMKCKEPDAWTPYTNTTVVMGKKIQPTLMKKGSNSFSLVSPTAFSRQGKRRRSGVSIDYIDSCSSLKGVVYTGSKSRSHLGVLTAAHKGSCSKKVAEVSLFQPFLSKRVLLKNLRPLHLMGSNAH